MFVLKRKPGNVITFYNNVKKPSFSFITIFAPNYLTNLLPYIIQLRGPSR